MNHSGLQTSKPSIISASLLDHALYFCYNLKNYRINTEIQSIFPEEFYVSINMNKVTEEEIKYDTDKNFHMSQFVNCVHNPQLVLYLNYGD